MTTNEKYAKKYARMFANTMKEIGRNDSDVLPNGYKIVAGWLYKDAKARIAENCLTFELLDYSDKNLTFKTGGGDGCDCAEILALIEAGKIDTTPLNTHRFKLEDIEEAYRVFENKLDGVIKIAIRP